MPLLSVIIITKNEAHTIDDCLTSVAWADEIIVVDSGSTDDTVSKCKSHGVKVTITDWPGFGPQKNRALALATCEWVLSIDADERISIELRKEIQSAIADPNGSQAFQLPRKSSYCGQFMAHSGWYPDFITRLFLRKKARFSADLVHERLIVDSNSIGKLKHPIIHHSFTDAEEVILKMNHYSSIRAQAEHARGKHASLFDAIYHGLWAFFKTYIIRLGFLDGKKGLMLAISNAEGSYYRYIKLMLLHEKDQGS